MMADRDDEDESDAGRKRTNAAPVLKPPGLGLGGHAPPGAVGTEKPWLEGPLYIGGFGPNPFRGGQSQEVSSAPDLSAQDKATPRFHETGDREVDREYAKNHVMILADGTELRPGELDRETEKQKQQSQSTEALEPESDAEQEQDLDRFYRKEETPAEPLDDSKLDRFYAQGDDGLGSDSSIENSLNRDFNERARRDGPDR